jgi:two-component system LytT family sensor kinase
MDFGVFEKIFQSRFFRYLLRIVVLFIFSVIFKSFDLTFIQDAGLGSFRSFFFSLFFVAYGFVSWEGAMYIRRFIDKKSTRESITGRLGALFVSLVVYGVLVSFFFGFFYASSDILLFERYEAWESFKSLSYNMNFGIFLFYMMIMSFNGIIYYYKKLHEYQVKTERLMRENIQARYDLLMNQIEPHFFFNSLSVLTNLVYKDADLSAEFVTRLAKCYRFILDKKFETLITIEEELTFLESYIFLIRVRHTDCILFDINIDALVKQKRVIPPATLQMLVENAVKHNRFSADEPLHIKFCCETGYLVVRNNKDKKRWVKDSTGIGLENIKKRYGLALGADVIIEEDAQYFTVKLPIP